MVEKLAIPTTPGFDFCNFLAKPTDVRDWNLKGLPADAFSVENGVLVTRGRRWPRGRSGGTEKGGRCATCWGT